MRLSSVAIFLVDAVVVGQATTTLLFLWLTLRPRRTHVDTLEKRLFTDLSE